MGQKLNRHPTKEDMQMANKPVNRCPHRMSSGKSTLNYNEILRYAHQNGHNPDHQQQQMPARVR